MKQNEIEKNTGPSAPASPAATKFIPYVTTYNSKPALVWRNEKGILSLVTADRQKVGTNKQLPVVKELEVIDGRKSRYAITKMGYLDLSNGNFVDAKTAAAIDAFRNTYAVKHTPVATPVPTPVATPAPEPAAVAPAPAPTPAFSWKDWSNKVKERKWPALYPDGVNLGFLLLEDIESKLTELSAEIVESLSKGIQSAIIDADLEAFSVEEQLSVFSEFAAKAKEDLLDLRSRNTYGESIEGIRWFPLTCDFWLSFQFHTGYERKAILHDAVSVDISAEDNAFIGIRSNGEILFAAEEEGELQVAATCQANSLYLDNENGEADFVRAVVQEVYGYHPDQLTLF